MDDTTPLEDTFLLAGLLGSSESDSLLEGLRASQQDLLDREKALSDAEIQLLEQQVEHEKKEHSLAEEQIAVLAPEKARNQATLSEAEIRRRGLEVQRLTEQRALAARRREYPLRLLKQRLQYLAEARESLSHWLLGAEQQRLATESTLNEQRFAAEKALFERELERRKSNAAEYERRSAFLESQRNRSERKFEELDGVLDQLRRLGVTRTTAGFLTWAGYLGFSVLGWLAGPAFGKAAAHGPSALHVLFLLVANALDSILQHGLLWATSVVVFGPVVLVTLIFGVFFAATALLRLFDPEWDTRDSSPRKQRSDRKQDVSSRRLPWTFFQVADTRKSDYTQLLAKLPILYFWLTLPLVFALLFTLGGRSIDPADLQGLVADPRQSFADGVFGVGICVLVSAFVMLYVLKVVEPRHRRTTEETSSPLRLNIEVVTLLGLLVFGTLIFDSLHMFYPRVPSFWSLEMPLGVLTLLLLNGFAVSCGLLYKGLFKDHAALRKEVQKLEEEIERYVAFPALEAAGDEVEQYVQRLRELHQEIERLWEETDFWEGSPVSPRKPWWRSFPRRRSAPAPSGELLVLDEILEPEAVQRISHVDQELAETEQVIVGLSSRNAEIDRALEGLKAKDSAASIRDLHRQIWARRAAFQSEVARLHRAYAELMVRCDTAYKLGSYLRTTFSPTIEENLHVA